jgi:hypothetical protein
MNKISRLLIALVWLAAVSLAAPAQAVIEFDQNVTPDVIFGSGNLNGSFTTDRQNGIEIGLRGKLRHDAAGDPQNIFNSNGDGTYFFNNIVAPTQASPTAEWSFEWSVNTDQLGSTGLFLDDFSYELGVDTDASLGTSFTTFDNISPSPLPWDHAIGTNITGNGGGTNAGGDIDVYLDLISTNNVAQNSWKYHWFAVPFDPTAVGTYAIYLLAKDSGGLVVARSHIQVLVGGAPPAPSPVVDIKPGSEPNSVNPRSKGVIPVAVLGSIDFDATQVDFSTVTFGPDGASPAHDGHVEDVDADGLVDMMFHFRTQETGIVCGDTEATLMGVTFTGTSFSGYDTVNTVGCKGTSSGEGTSSEKSETSSGANAVSWIMLLGLGVLGLWRLNRRVILSN